MIYNPLYLARNGETVQAGFESMQSPANVKPIILRQYAVWHPGKATMLFRVAELFPLRPTQKLHIFGFHMKLIVGCSYVGGGFAREIIAFEGKDVLYRDFSLNDGKPWGSCRRCQRNTFRSWVTRECTAEEAASFRRDEPAREDQMRDETALKIRGFVEQFSRESSLR